MTDLNRMSHKFYEETTFALDGKSIIRASSKDPKLLNLEVIVSDDNVINEDYKFLLMAAPFLYQQLSRQCNALQLYIDYLEKVQQKDEFKDLIKTFTGLQNGIFLAQEIAQIGVNAVHEKLPKK